MRVLVACEFSGVVRDAFIARGHDALSCDLLPGEVPGPHYQGDVRQILSDGWDLMIAHPPCTHLAVSGAWKFREKEKEKEQRESLELVELLLGAPIERIALENPVSIISSRIRRPDQILQPWQFGHRESKTTCLWLKNLPRLKATVVLKRPVSDTGLVYERWENQTVSGQNRLSPGPDRWKLRSRTYDGIAKAMAEQWGSIGRPAWQRCRCCGEFWCNIHNCHTGESRCECPPIEEWGDVDPYSPAKESFMGGERCFDFRQ